MIFLSACSLFYPWQSAYHRDHVLVGKIWKTDEARFIDQDELIADINKRNFILLGETHNNPDKAPSDGPCMLPLKDLQVLLEKLIELDFVTKNN